MPFLNFFIDPQGRLRSVWRFVLFSFLFIVNYLLCLTVWGMLLLLVTSLAGGSGSWVGRNGGSLTHFLSVLSAASLTGWGCGRAFERLPGRALGWWFHERWGRDFALGSLLGAASLLLAAIIGVLAGSFRFAFTPLALFPSMLETLLSSAFFFLLAGAAEESLFRGYPLQTMLRAWPVWAALLPSSLLFGWVHLGNPNTIGGFTFVNTALAGIWLAIAYLRTRSLWFPLGVHWSWNWTQGALLGLPVSGITRMTPQPLLHATDNGPAWLTGGAYGIEGGAACTLALLLSSFFFLRTKFITATNEMKRLTSIQTDPAIPSPSRTSHSSPPALVDGSIEDQPPDSHPAADR